MGLFMLGALLVTALVTLQGRGDGRIRLGSLDRVSPGAVVYHASDHVFVIRQADGIPLVLSDLDPHNPPGSDSCRVTFRPDLGGTDAAAGRDGGTGRFFDACTRSTYDRTGRGLQGDGLDLRRVAFELDARGQLSIAPDDAASAPRSAGRTAATRVPT